MGGKKKWIAGCGVLALTPVVVMALLVWSVVPGRVEGQYFDSGGVQIHYTDEGSGTPVVLVHGLAGNGDMNWRHPGTTEALAKDYRVVTLDHRGHGLSDKPHDPAQYGFNMVKDVLGLMDHLGIEKAHVVGYSMGAFITTKMVTVHPERFLSVVPCAAGWEPANEENRAFMEAVAKALESGEGFGPLGKRLGLENERPNPLRKFMVNLVLFHLNDGKAMAAAVRGFTELVVTEAELKANKVPALSMVGSKDGLRSGVEKLAERMGNHELLIIEGGDHLTTPGFPAFLKGLQAFLAKHTP